jgi:hypothetical protein
MITGIPFSKVKEKLLKDPAVLQAYADEMSKHGLLTEEEKAFIEQAKKRLLTSSNP